MNLVACSTNSRITYREHIRTCLGEILKASKYPSIAMDHHGTQLSKVMVEIRKLWDEVILQENLIKGEGGGGQLMV